MTHFGGFFNSYISMDLETKPLPNFKNILTSEFRLVSLFIRAGSKGYEKV